MTQDRAPEAAPQSPEMSEPLLSIREDVMTHWEREVRARVDGAGASNGPALREPLLALLDHIAMALARGGAAPIQEDEGMERPQASDGFELARHGSFGPERVAHEYQIFRESIAAVAEGRIDMDARQTKLIDETVNVAMRRSLRSLAHIHEQARRQVAAALSHDMRTPLAVIANGAQLVSLTSDMEKARQAAAKIEANAARLSGMVADLLDALTVQGRANLTLRISQFDALELAAEVVEQYREGGNLGFEFEVYGDHVIGHWCRDSMRRAMENLVNNAIKYGAGGAIQVGARAIRNRLVISVRNAGNPIPESTQESIFEYFRREKDATAIAGWGIGLPFVKAVAESHGGDVSLDSSAERGTTFFVHVPLDARPFVNAFP